MKLPRNEFCALVEQALSELPAEFRRHLEGLTVDVQDEPDEALLRELDIEDRRALLGLYRGQPLTDRSVSEPVRWPDRILIFQKNVERICRRRTEIVEEVRITVLHELGHHFGLDEGDLDELGYA